MKPPSYYITIQARVHIKVAFQWLDWQSPWPPWAQATEYGAGDWLERAATSAQPIRGARLSRNVMLIYANGLVLGWNKRRNASRCHVLFFLLLRILLITLQLYTTTYYIDRYSVYIIWWLHYNIITESSSEHVFHGSFLAAVGGRFLGCRWGASWKSIQTFLGFPTIS